jgi:hypothetical protein
MSDNAKDTKPEPIMEPSVSKKAKMRMSGDSNSTSQIMCAPGEHAICDNTSGGAVPLHPPSFASSPRGDTGSSVDVAFSEVSSGKDADNRVAMRSWSFWTCSSWSIRSLFS